MIMHRMTRAAPVAATGTAKVFSSAVEMELACVMLPIPKDASTVNSANRKPKIAPSCLFENPFFMVNMGPPFISPFSLTSRYLLASIHSAYLVVIPKAAESHIQTRAPGPPANMAVATPTILPVPMVAERAVISALKEETSPSPPAFFCLASLPITLLIE